MLAFLRLIYLPALIIVLALLWFLLEQSPEQLTGKTVLRWVVNSQERDQVFARAICRAFEGKHSNIRIQFIKTNEGRKVETMIAGGDAPDILQVGMDRVHYFIKAQVLRNLEPFMSLSDKKDLEGFFPVTLEPFVVEKNLYAIPWGYVPFVLFYNKNLFDKYGVPYPTENWTWDDYRRAAIRMTRDLDNDGITDEFGASFAQWHDGYYCWVYQNGGRVLSNDRTRTTFDEPRVVQAVDFLHQLTRIDRSIPTDINKPRQTGMGLFEAGRMAMHGPTGSFYITTYRDYANVDWDIASVPSGPRGKGTMVAPLAFGVTRQSRHPREAYELVRFLCGTEGQRILAKSGLFVPSRRSVAFSDEFLRAPDRPKNKYALVAMMDDRKGKKPWGIVPPWSSDLWGDVNEILNDKLGSFLFGIPKAGETARSVCAFINREANEIIEEDRNSKSGSAVPWHSVAIVALGVFVVVGGVYLAAAWRASAKSTLSRGEQAWGYLAISPWLTGFVLFSAGPIVFSILLSFMRWNSLAPPSQARFVGIENYAVLIGGRDDLMGKSLLATARYAILAVPLHLALGLALALLMNTRLRVINLFRTIYYLPAIMPTVATAVLFGWIFRQQGILNFLLGGFGSISFKQMPDWMNDPRCSLPAIVLMSLWGVGGGMMIYLAGLQNIPTQLYEAAQVDGAGLISQFRMVTLPMLSPVLFFNLVLGIIGAFQVFTSAFVLFSGSAGPDNSALFYSFYLYRKAFEQFQFGYASAMAWILFLIVLGLTLIVFRSSSLWVYYESQREARA